LKGVADCDALEGRAAVSISIRKGEGGAREIPYVRAA
jgi:hypothetical protein